MLFYLFLILKLRLLVRAYVKENQPVGIKAIIGLPDLENKNTWHPVKIELYIVNNCSK